MTGNVQVRVVSFRLVMKELTKIHLVDRGFDYHGLHCNAALNNRSDNPFFRGITNVGQEKPRRLPRRLPSTQVRSFAYR